VRREIERDREREAMEVVAPGGSDGTAPTGALERVGIAWLGSPPHCSTNKAIISLPGRLSVTTPPSR
jgi:hypothetical protein